MNVCGNMLERGPRRPLENWSGLGPVGNGAGYEHKHGNPCRPGGRRDSRSHVDSDTLSYYGYDLA
jgi:hypothetical protein